MKINFSQRLKTIKGLPMFEKSFETMVISKALKMAGKGFASLEELLTFLDEAKVTFSQVVQDEGVPFCLKDVCVEALMLRDKKVSEELPGREDIIRYKLALAITDAVEPLSVKPSEIRMMVELISFLTLGGPMVIGQASAMLEEGEPEESDDREPPARLKSEAHEARREPREPRGQVPSRRN